MTLIELHIRIVRTPNTADVFTEGIRTAINVERILAIRSHRKGCTLFCDNGENQWTADESYDEVMDMIREATAETEPEDFVVPGFLTEGGGGNE